MRLSFIVIPALFLVLLLAGILPSPSHIQPAPLQILPSTSLLPLAATTAETGPSVSMQPVFPGLGEFASAVLNDNPNAVVGIYVEDLFALPVTQQPQDQPAYVSDENNLLTQFGMPGEHGVVGILAHNYLSGGLFYDLEEGDEVVVIYGDGRSDLFRVTHSENFQALNPTSPYSDFIEQGEPSGEKISSAELYNHIYSTPYRLVFQTCIEANGDPSWGRYFVTAVKDTSIEIHLPKLFALSNN